MGAIELHCTHLPIVGDENTQNAEYCQFVGNIPHSAFFVGDELQNMNAD